MLKLLFITLGDNPPISISILLNLAPTPSIQKAVEKLMFSENDNLAKLALTLCDWLLQWPRATKLSQWIIYLFKMLTNCNKSSIVAIVISQKAPKVY